jgi:hypothetical protein
LRFQIHYFQEDFGNTAESLSSRLYPKATFRNISRLDKKVQKVFDPVWVEIEVNKTRNVEKR